jgi:hypothetical protein
MYELVDDFCLWTFILCYLSQVATIQRHEFGLQVLYWRYLVDALS